MKIEDFKNGISDIKPDPYMETRITQNVFEAAPKKRSKRKFAVAAISAMLSLVLLVTVLGFAGFSQEFIPDTSNTNYVEFLPIGGFDGNYEYIYAYDYRLHFVDAYLIEYIRDNLNADIDDWLSTDDMESKKSDYKIGSPDDKPLLIKVIDEFNVPKENFEEINNLLYEINEQHGWTQDNTFTQEEIDTIYSKDFAAIAKVFASDYAIITEDIACAPIFYLNATQDELEQYGITVSEVNYMTEILIKDSIVETQK